ncbi:MAG: tRNA pseudouridine(55) synthase TruB [Bacteroidia bacterium]
MTAEDVVNGKIFLIDKPLDWTSFDAVNKIRYALKKHFNIKKIKVGHAGTLDPKATGLLIICAGKKTKDIDQLMGLEKEYTGTIKLGATTPSYDLETEENEQFSTEHITENLLHEVAQSFVGIQQQIPPLFSAKKIDGVRAYEFARRGEDVELKANQVEIKEFEITSVNANFVNFKIVCSKGTYIRSIARDFGEKLNSGAYLTALRRTKIGDFSIENAQTIEQFIQSL